MRHSKLGYRLGVCKEHRLAILRNLFISLVINKKIKTTESKGKALKRFFDKTLTAIRRNNESFNKHRAIAKKLGNVNWDVRDKIMKLNPSRTSGLLSIKKVGFRRGDGADMVMLEIL